MHNTISTQLSCTNTEQHHISVQTSNKYLLHFNNHLLLHPLLNICIFIIIFNKPASPLHLTQYPHTFTTSQILFKTTLPCFTPTLEFLLLSHLQITEEDQLKFLRDGPAKMSGISVNSGGSLL